MPRKLSVEEIIASLEAQAAVYREREAHHSAQEALHREERERNAAELETVTRRLDEFRAAAAAAGELAERDVARTVAAADAEEDFGPASKPRLARMVRKVVAGLGPNRAFGANWVAREVNDRFGSKLRKQVDVPQMSAVLRRMHRLGELQLHRPGTARREARYVLQGTG